MDILFSIIIPVYNGEKFLEKCVASLDSYKDNDIEIIVIDDGSSDNTPQICDKLQSTNSRVKAFHIKNEGVSNARNFGISQAKGKYIMFLDSDDMLFDNALVDAKKKLDNKAFDLVMFPYSIMLENDEIKENISIFDTEAPTREDVFRSYITTDNMNYCWGKLYDREFLLNSNVKFDTSLAIGEDVKFFFEYVDCKPVMAHFDIPMVKYRQVSSSAIHNYDFSKFKELSDGVRVRLKMAEEINFRPEDKDRFYLNMGRRLLSYVKHVSNLKNINSVAKRLNTELQEPYLRGVLENLPYERLDIVRRIIGKLLKKHHYYIVVLILGITG